MAIDEPAGRWLYDKVVAQLNAEMDELRAAPPFDVFGLAGPELSPSMLVDCGKRDADWYVVSLFYGARESSSGPAVTVRSVLHRSAGDRLERELVDVLAAERGRVAGARRPVPPGRVLSARARLSVGGSDVEAELVRDGGVWAARGAIPVTRFTNGARVVVTVSGRGVALEDVRLARVGDLTPFIEQREQLVARYRGQAAPAAREPRVAAVSIDRVALRALIEETIGRVGSRRPGREVTAGADDGSRPGSQDDRRYRLLWRTAVEAHAKVCRRGDEEAGEQVALIVGQMMRLAEKAEWFTSRPHLRDGAIRETLVHAIEGGTVASGDAQRAWLTCWRADQDLEEVLRRLRILPEARRALSYLIAHQRRREAEAAWLAAWARWVVGTS